MLSVRSRRIERVGRSKLIQTNLTEPDVELFMNLTDTKFDSSHEKFHVWPRPMITVDIQETYKDKKSA